MKIVKSEDFENTVFENEGELITLVVNSKFVMWTTPKNYKHHLEQYKLWENSEEYRKLEYEFLFGKNESRD